MPFLLQPTSLRQIRFVNIPLEAGLPAQKVFILPLRNDPQSVLRSDAEVLSPKVGAEILLRISREFGKTMEWLLTGETFKLVFAQERFHDGRVVRYETTLERKKEKAINLLMKLQAKG